MNNVAPKYNFAAQKYPEHYEPIVYIDYGVRAFVTLRAGIFRLYSNRLSSNQNDHTLYIEEPIPDSFERDLTEEEVIYAAKTFITDFKNDFLL